MQHHALVAGATGVVCQAIIEHLRGQDGWRVSGLSRGAARGTPDPHWHPVDLLDSAACRQLAEALPGVTHLFYTAFAPATDAAQEAALNLEMLRNLVQAVQDSCPGLRHIQLMQGSKWYGSHLGPYRTPAREDQPRHPQAAFYFAQQDWLTQAAQHAAWSWSALRPHGIWGYATRSSLSPLNAIATYAAVMKHLGLPLHFPGKVKAYDAIYQCTDAEHLARGMVWAASAPAARNQAFNLTNGDYLRWRHAWPLVAAWFRMPVGDVIPMSLSDFMADKQALWLELVDRHGLVAHRLHDLTDYRAAERYLFNAEWDQMSANTKAQLAGWTQVVDTYEMIPRLLQRLVDERVIPAP